MRNRLKSRTPELAAAYQPSAEHERVAEQALRNADRRARWRDYQQAAQQARLQKMRRAYVQRRDGVRMRTVRS